MIAGIERAAFFGPVAVAGVVAWIFVRRAMVRSLMGRGRQPKAPIPYDAQLRSEGFSTPREKERATRQELKYARRYLKDNDSSKSGD
jgi:hypothetical protein